MVKFCCVEGCINKWGLTVAGKKVSFFKIPRASGKQGNLRKHREWLAAINRANWDPHPEDVVCGMHFLTGQPSNDPKHPDYRPQILPNRIIDLKRLQEDLENWEKNRDKNPPVIEVEEKELNKQQLILPKGFSLSLQQPLLISNQQLTVISQQPAITSLVGHQQLIMTTKQTAATASNGTLESENLLSLKPLEASDEGSVSDAAADDVTSESMDTGLDSNQEPIATKSKRTLKPGKPLETSDQDSMTDIKMEHSGNAQSHNTKSAPKSENSFMSALSLKPMNDTETGSDSTADQAQSNGISMSSEASAAGDIRIEPLNMSPNQTPTSISAAALMSALATTAGLGKSVGTTVDLPETTNTSSYNPKSSKGKKKEIDEGAISKAIIKTPVKIKNTGEDESIRFMTQYMCRYCAQRFDSMTKMQEHVAGHLKGKHTNHTCSVCGKEYRTPSKLQRHVRVHSGERPYACTVCGRRFTRSDHVKQHMKVHLPPQELNVCRLCATRFLKRQSLQLHLQQAHLVNQLFTCNACGEAFESLEQLNAHNLTHDAILNSMNADGKATEAPTLQGLAKFAVGPNIKQVEPSKMFTKIEGKRPIAPKPEPAPKPDSKKEAIVTDETPKYNYVLTLDAPENQEDVTKISDKLITESMEEESKKYEELKRQFEEQSKVMAETLERERQEREKEESKKIAAAFNIDKADQFENIEDKGDDSMDVGEYDSPAVLTSEDGMSMYISTAGMLKMDEENDESNIHSDGSDSNVNEVDYSEMKDDDENTEKELNDEANDLNKDTKKETRKTPHSVVPSSKKAYKPGPLWYKTAQEIHRSAVRKEKSEKILNVPKVDTSKTDKEIQPKMVSCIKPSINELLKAKVEQKNLNVTENDKSIIVTSIAPQQPVPIAPRQVQQYILVSQPSPQPTSTQVTPQSLQKSGMLRCEHCCIWFEDRAMSLLHNTLHSADKMDPFTCRKCYKKMGNRLEFMAHLIWHLEPNMDI